MRRLPSVRIIIPAYNEVGRISDTIRDYCETFSGIGTVLVVANGCTDGTASLVRTMLTRYDNLQVIEIAGKIGKGGAVRAGLWTGEEPYVGFVDADRSTSASEFLRLFNALCQDPLDGVIGSRWMRGSRVEPEQPVMRRIASRAFNAIVRTLFGLPYSDTQCGAKIFTRRAISQIFQSLEVANFAFDIEVLWLLKRNNFVIDEVPTAWSDCQAGTKVQIVATSLSMLKSVLRMRLRQSSLWLLPFIDRLAHKSVMPVVESHRILLLGGTREDLDRCPNLRDLFHHLETLGYRLCEPEPAKRKSRFSILRTLGWYVLKSNRDYEAIIEIARPALAWIPAFSLKPSFILSTSEFNLTTRHKTVYQRASFIDLTHVPASEAADTILLTQSGAALYSAVFYSGTGPASVQYTTLDGLRERHILQR